MVNCLTDEKLKPANESLQVFLFVKKLNFE